MIKIRKTYPRRQRDLRNKFDRLIGGRAGASLKIALFLCVGNVLAGPAPGSAPGIGNFHQVSDRLFRGAQPSTLGLQELGALGVERVIDLREPGQSTAFEEEQLKKLGVEYINIPFQQFSAPSDNQIQAVLKLLTSGDKVTFIHCRRGKDRTGTAIACYRVQHDGWQNDRALREAKMYGMSSLERGMQHYILHFIPTHTPQLSPAAPSLAPHSTR
jgi:protein tyrosine/serine phosphatase